MIEISRNSMLRLKGSEDYENKTIYIFHKLVFNSMIAGEVEQVTPNHRS
jgi:hypothetical protein